MKLDKEDHRSLVLWAADCAEHGLGFFEEKHPRDDRPRKGIEAGRAWVRGEIALTEACADAFAAHARNAAAYAVTAATDSVVTTGAATAKERDWQSRRLPKHLLSGAFPAQSMEGAELGC